jgi:hypothetical protein
LSVFGDVLRRIFGGKLLRRIFGDKLLRRIFGEGVLRRIIAHKKGEITMGWIRAHKFYCSSDISRRMRWEGHVECMGDIKLNTIFWFGKRDVKTPLGWEDFK